MRLLRPALLPVLLVLGWVGPGWPARAEDRPARGFAALPGWADDDESEALDAFRRGCATASLAAACRAAARVPARDRESARRFFETWFEPVEVAARGFLTGYFEPVFAGSLSPDATYRFPLLGKPAGLVVRSAGAVPAGWPPGMTAAIRTTDGYRALPDRAAIEDGALGTGAVPVVFLADPVDVFTVHVQGSARVALPDGRTVRVGFDGRNGHPYTPIARVLADQEGVPPAQMTADRLWAWLKANPDRAPAIMRANRSFIFFRRLEASGAAGPVGAAGVPLTAGRSLAVDRSAWPYGTPVWLEGEVPDGAGRPGPLRRLVIAQDTGAAILGRARGDLFTGSGEAAGRQAALIRHPVRWVVLRSRHRLGRGRAPR